MELIVVSDKLAAWNVSEENYPRDGSLDDKLKFLLRYAVLAPSGPNNQPWKLSLQGDSVSLIADFGRALPNVDVNNRTLYMSCGCLLTNLLLAAEHFGFGYEVSYLPDGVDGERIARIRFVEGGNALRFPPLFRYITERHTNRKPYQKRAVEPDKLQRMLDSIDEQGFRLDIITDDARINAMSDLLARAHKIQLGNKAFRKELASWVRSNTGDEKDGLPGYAFGYSDFESYFGSFIFGTFDMSGSRARVETAYMKASPAVAVLSSDKDDKPTWIKAGMVFEKLFLTATELDVRFDLFSQPVGIPELRKEMADTLNVRYPQLLIRMGYAEPAMHTPRRPVEEVLVP